MAGKGWAPKCGCENITIPYRTVPDGINPFLVRTMHSPKIGPPGAFPRVLLEVGDLMVGCPARVPLNVDTPPRSQLLLVRGLSPAMTDAPVVFLSILDQTTPLFFPFKRPSPLSASHSAILSSFIPFKPYLLRLYSCQFTLIRCLKSHYRSNTILWQWQVPMFPDNLAKEGMPPWLALAAGDGKLG
jgi:hypothetical protein